MNQGEPLKEYLIYVIQTGKPFVVKYSQVNFIRVTWNNVISKRYENLFRVTLATFSNTLQPLAVNKFSSQESLEPIVDLQQDKGILYSKRISHLHSLCIATQVRESRSLWNMSTKEQLWYPSFDTLQLFSNPQRLWFTKFNYLQYDSGFVKPHLGAYNISYTYVYIVWSNAQTAHVGVNSRHFSINLLSI